MTAPPRRVYVPFVRGNTNYGINDFVNNGDGTITDEATGLMWAQNDSGSGMDWQDALAWVQTMNAAGLPGLQRLAAAQRQGDAEHPRLLPGARRHQLRQRRAGHRPDVQLHPDHRRGRPGRLSLVLDRHDPPAIQRPAYDAAYAAFGQAMGYMTSTWLDVHGGRHTHRSQDRQPQQLYLRALRLLHCHAPQGDAIRIYNYVRLVRGGAPGTAASLAASSATGTYGGTTTLTATLTSSGAGVPNETVAFTLGGTTVGTATTNSSGIATLSGIGLAALAAGTYTGGVQASSTGDSVYAPASASGGLTISTAATTTDPFPRRPARRPAASA